jgi:hypothetical protein
LAHGSVYRKKRFSQTLTGASYLRGKTMNRRNFLLVTACPELERPEHDVTVHIESECQHVIVTFDSSVRYLHLTATNARKIADLLKSAAGDPATQQS